MTKPDYFLINRKLQESDLWLNEPFTRGQAWVDLLGLAHYKPGHIRKDGKRIELERGQCGWSQLKLSKRWGWSRGKVKRFLTELEIDERIVQFNTTICSIITILNYDEYQPNGHQTDTKQSNGRTTDETTDGQLTDTINEGVEGSKGLIKDLNPSRKNPKPKKKTAKPLLPKNLDEVVQYAQSRNSSVDPKTFWEHYEAANPPWCDKGGDPVRAWKQKFCTWERREDKKRENEGSIFGRYKVLT